MARYLVWKDDRERTVMYRGKDRLKAVKTLESLDSGLMRQYVDLGERMIVSQSFWHDRLYQIDDPRSMEFFLDKDDLELILEEREERKNK